MFIPLAVCFEPVFSYARVNYQPRLLLASLLINLFVLLRQTTLIKLNDTIEQLLTYSLLMTSLSCYLLTRTLHKENTSDAEVHLKIIGPKIPSSYMKTAERRTSIPSSPLYLKFSSPACGEENFFFKFSSPPKKKFSSAVYYKGNHPIADLR